jgi:hypothetical protein
MPTTDRSPARPATVAARAAAPATGVRLLGAACVAGGALGVLITTAQLASTPSSTTPEELWRYPWSSHVFVVVGLLWCVSHALCLSGFVGLRRSGHAGPGRAAAAGAALTITGTALILAGELAGLTIGDQAEDSGAASIVASIYALGTLLAVGGLVLVGRQVVRMRTWTGWRRWVPLTMAGWGVMLLWLPLTPLAPVGSLVIDMLFVALGVALFTRPTPDNS